MIDLANRLNINLAHANGIMTRLWYFVGRYAPAGDIGKWPNPVIADTCAWPPEQADTLITALIDAHWLDPHKQHRLIIHDWAEHAEDLVHNKLARATARFATGEYPKLTRLAPKEREAIAKKYDQPDLFATPPPPRKPRAKRPPKPREPSPDCAPFADFWAAWPEDRRVDRKGALAEWKRLNPDPPLYALILAAVKKQRHPGGPLADDQATKFKPHPKRWLKNRRFEDAVPDPPREAAEDTLEGRDPTDEELALLLGDPDQ